MNLDQDQRIEENNYGSQLRSFWDSLILFKVTMIYEGGKYLSEFHREVTLIVAYIFNIEDPNRGPA